MTREEAIKNLQEIIEEGWLISDFDKCTAIDACEMAIKALEQEPCEDCISRQSVINAIANTCFWLSNDNWKELTKCINSISPVTPQQTKKLAEYLWEEPKTWSLDDAREDFTSDVYDTLDFLPTNNEANRIIDSFDRVTSSIKQEPVTCPSAGIDCGDCPASEQEPCEDAISRKNTLAEFKRVYFDNDTVIRCAELVLGGMPSVTSQPKTGHWITTRTFMHDGEFYCDKCKCDSPNNEKWDYCPNCGAKMEVEE